jgi:death-on-curing protein
MALVFLLLNGCDFKAPQGNFADMVLAVASEEMSKAEAILYFRRWTTRS